METYNRLQRDWNTEERCVPDKTEVQIAAEKYVEDQCIQGIAKRENQKSYIAGWNAKEEQQNNSKRDEWIDNLDRAMNQESLENQLTGIPEDIALAARERFPINPWNMRGPNYPSIDLNYDKRGIYINARIEEREQDTWTDAQVEELLLYINRESGWAVTPQYWIDKYKQKHSK